MSEYWVSKKRYFCKYCNVYIADDAPSRQHHESGLRHKGNMERFIRGIYKAGEKRIKDAAEEKREMARIEKAAQGAFAQDVSSGIARQSLSSSILSTSSTSSSSKVPAKSSNPYANYSTAASLGYTDPDAERIVAEELRRNTEGSVGQWEILEPPPPPPTEVPSITDEGGSDTAVGIKREADADPDDTRRFKIQKKTLGTGLGEIYDPGKIEIPLKIKKEDSLPAVSASTQSANTPNESKWIKKEWSPLESASDGDASIALKRENITSETTNKDQIEPNSLKQEESDQPLPPSGLFKKRKAPAGTRNGRREV